MRCNHIIESGLRIASPLIAWTYTRSVIPLVVSHNLILTISHFYLYYTSILSNIYITIYMRTLYEIYKYFPSAIYQQFSSFIVKIIEDLIR